MTAMTPAPPRQAMVEAVAPRLAMFLEILSAMGGQADASDCSYNWINAFCEAHEGRDPDTFNRAIDAGYVHWSHDSDSDNSTIRLTDEGRAAILAMRVEEEVCPTCGCTNTAFLCSNGFHGPLRAEAPAELDDAAVDVAAWRVEGVEELVERVARGELESQQGSFGPFDSLEAFCTWLRRRRLSSVIHNGKEIIVVEVDEGGSPDPDCQQAADLLERLTGMGGG